MAATQVAPVPEIIVFDESNPVDRQAIIDSVLGTMGAEGEMPSDAALAFMHKFIIGEMTHDEMSEAILAHATRMVHEATTRRLAVR